MIQIIVIVIGALFGFVGLRMLATGKLKVTAQRSIEGPKVRVPGTIALVLGVGAVAVALLAPEALVGFLNRL
jgi:hypothetical protein